MNYNPQSNKQLKGGLAMLKKLKIAFLIVILAEEIRSDRKRTVKVSASIDEKQLTKIVNEENAKNGSLIF